MREFQEALDQSRPTVQSRTPSRAREIERTFATVRKAVSAGAPLRGKAAATTLLEALNEAVSAINGVAPASGVVQILQSLRAAARDLSEEIRFKDKDGIERAVAAVGRLYASSRAQITQRAPKSSSSIAEAIEALREAERSGDTADCRPLRSASRTPRTQP